MKVFSFMLIFFVFCGTSFAAEGDAKIGISGPVTLVDGAAYWGANSALEYSISSRWSLGLDSGFFYRHKSYPGSTVSGWILPLLPSVFYDPAMGTAVFHPYFGLGAGPVILHNSLAVDSSPRIGFSDTSVKLEMLVHLAATFGKKRRIFADLRMGLLDGDFVFAPGVGWNFSL